jgi:hypothetical protein
MSAAEIPLDRCVHRVYGVGMETPMSATETRRAGDLQVGDIIDFDRKRGVWVIYDRPEGESYEAYKATGQATITAVELQRYRTTAQTGRGGVHVVATFDNGHTTTMVQHTKLPVVVA